MSISSIYMTQLASSRIRRERNEKLQNVLAAQKPGISKYLGLTKQNEVNNNADIAKLHAISEGANNNIFNSEQTSNAAITTKEPSTNSATSADAATTANANYTLLATSLGYTLTGNAEADKKALKEKGDFLYSMVSNMNPTNYKLMMPFLSKNLSLPWSGNIQESQLVYAKANVIKSAIDTLS